MKKIKLVLKVLAAFAVALVLGYFFYVGCQL